MNLWHRAWRELGACLDLLLPPACLLCGARLPAGISAGAFCPTCRAAVPPMPPARCPVCAVAHRTPVTSLHHCESCLRQPPAFARVVAAGPYAGTLREAVQRFKYRGQLTLERPLGQLLAEAVTAAGGPSPDLVVPVPLHVGRLRERGYNQSLQLARRLAGELGAPTAATLLRRTRATAPQQGLDATARKGNLRGAFAVAERLGGRRILLVDDVLTTGATVRECAAVLRRAGAAAVEVAVLGRA